MTLKLYIEPEAEPDQQRPLVPPNVVAGASPTSCAPSRARPPGPPAVQYAPCAVGAHSALVGSDIGARVARRAGEIGSSAQGWMSGIDQR